MEISAAMVRDLREKTGLPMMDCKKALQEAGGDVDAAIAHLREAGKMKLAKRADREAGEGRIAIAVDGAKNRVGMVELRCESAPVANTEDFAKLAMTVAAQVAATGKQDPEQLRDLPLASGGTLGDHIDDVFNRLRERLAIARAYAAEGVVGTYVHHNAQVGVVCEFSGDCPPELRADVCMHIAAMNPAALKREDVDPADVERERELAAKDAEGKPAQIIEKIVSGKLDRYFAEFVLLEQAFVKDDKKSVSQVLKEVSPNLTIKAFRRFQVGG